MLHRGAGTSRVSVRPAATEPSGAVLGPAAASPQRGDKSLYILLVSPIGLQNTRNNYIEHNKTNTCSSHLLAPSNNNYYYSFLFQCCLQPRGEQRLMLPGSGGMASCVVFFFMIKAGSLCAPGYLIQAQEGNGNTASFPVTNTGRGAGTSYTGNPHGLFPTRQLQRCLSACPLLYEPEQFWFNFS